MVEPLPPDTKSVSGMLIYNGTQFGIQYATYIDNIGFQHFCVAHELGHFSIPAHPEKLLGGGIHRSHAGFVADERSELEADHFAAGLLMPGYLFDAEMAKVQSGMAAVAKLHSACETSMTATAIRYAQRSPDPVAIIVSQGRAIDYCFMSDEFREIEGLNWIRKGTPLPTGSVTARFNASEDNILGAASKEGDTNIQDWFGGCHSYEMYEEVVGLGSYGKTLTVLSMDSVPDTEELEDEERLKESWTPRFRR